MPISRRTAILAAISSLLVACASKPPELRYVIRVHLWDVDTLPQELRAHALALAAAESLAMDVSLSRALGKRLRESGTPRSTTPFVATVHGQRVSGVGGIAELESTGDMIAHVGIVLTTGTLISPAARPFRLISHDDWRSALANPTAEEMTKNMVVLHVHFLKGK